MAFVFDLQGLAVADILQRRARKQSKSPRSNEVMFDPGFRAEKVRRDKLHRRGKKRSKKLRSRVWPGFPSSAMRCEEVTVTALRPKLSSGNRTQGLWRQVCPRSLSCPTWWQKTQRFLSTESTRPPMKLQVSTSIPLVASESRPAERRAPFWEFPGNLQNCHNSVNSHQECCWKFLFARHASQEALEAGY